LCVCAPQPMTIWVAPPPFFSFQVGTLAFFDFFPFFLLLRRCPDVESFLGVPAKGILLGVQFLCFRHLLLFLLVFMTPPCSFIEPPRPLNFDASSLHNRKPFLYPFWRRTVLMTSFWDNTIRLICKFDYPPSPSIEAPVENCFFFPRRFSFPSLKFSMGATASFIPR